MKRIFLRMSALATVVALGTIAIAQAQRGVDDPIAAAVAGKTDSHNPLRQAKHETEDAGVVPEAALNDERPSLGSEAAKVVAPRTLSGNDSPAQPPSVSPQVVAGTPADPFSHMASDINTSASEESGRTAAGGRAALESLSNALPPSGSPQSDRTPAESRPSFATRPQAPGDDTALTNPSLVVPRSGAAVGPPPGEIIDSAPRSLPERAFADGGYSTVSRPAQIPVETGSREMSAPTALPLAAGTGSPGDRQLEGPQTPQLTIEKIAPKEIRIGKPATFVVKVRNTGRVVAGDVEIRDRIPRGTKLDSSNPPASRGPQGELIWQLGAVEPNAEVSVEVVLTPIEEGEIGSVATVHFNAAASARTIVTKPQLVLQISMPEKVLIGGDVPLSITISNPGSGVATGVILEEHIPAGLEHAAGSELEYEVGDLAPNESRQLDLVLKAVQPGMIANLLTARDDANLVVEDRREIQVIAPQLAVALEGPKRRYLGRQATYALVVKNPGTAPAQQVELVAHLPGGLSFVSANNNGSYDETSGTVRWNLEELPVAEVAQVEFAAMPVEAGEQMIRFSTSDKSGLSAETQQPVLVEGIAAVSFEVVDVDDPIEVGEQTTYEIKVVNQGSKVATNVRLAAYLPPGLQFVSAEGPMRHADEPGRVIFEPLPRLAPKADTTYRVRVQGVQPGDLRLRVELSTDEGTQPVSKEESTRVYTDE